MTNMCMVMLLARNFCNLFSFIYFFIKDGKLDGVGPVDNRPSTDKLHQIFQKKIKKINKKL